MRAIVRTIAAALALLSGGAATPASAQRVDGNAIVKFGVFQQTTLMHVSDSIVGGESAGPTDHGTAASGLHGGLSAGIDFHLPYRWLLGLEIDASLGDARVGVNEPVADYGFDYLFNLRGRLGYYVLPDLMLYGTTGLSYLGWEAQRRGTSGKAAETVPGYILGIGLEYEWHHVLLFAEYNHGWYDTRAYTFDVGVFDERRTADSEVDAIRLGMKFKVGHDHHGWGRWYDPKPLK